MKIKRTLIRIAAPVLSAMVLAACQTPPSADSATDQESQAVAQTTPQTAAQDPTSSPANDQGAPVGIFLADVTPQENWHPVQLDAGMLYLNPQPVIVREDLVGVQAGANQEGVGLLALALGPDAQRKIEKVTTDNPNKRLALIVGQTLLAAPGYTTPVILEHLIFAVGTEQDATSVARAIAGVSADGSEPVQPDGAGSPDRASSPAAQ